MEKVKWDLLQPQDIEVRVGGKIKGTDNVTMLLYQDSRCTARNLDKQFGQFGWQIDYKVVGEQIYGTLSIWDETKQQWVAKSDTGDKSNISEDKGQSSDILKRCAVRWGFGTELYTAPKIVIPDDGYGNSGYKVSEINYNDNREITHLVVVNKFNKEVFRWNNGSVSQHPVQQAVNVAMNIAEDASKTVSIEEELDDVPMLTKRTKTTPETLKNDLKAFVVNTHNEENEEEIKRFYNFYYDKCDTWQGLMNIPALWNSWWGKARKTT